MGRGEAWALSGDVVLRSARLWADTATITEWALQGRRIPAFVGLSGFAIGRFMEIAMTDASRPREVVGAAFGFGLASHAKKSADAGRRTEAYAMLRLVTTACAAPTALGRAYQLGARGSLSWIDVSGCVLDVLDSSVAAGAATLGAGAIWKRIRSKTSRTGQFLGLSIGYAADNALRLAAYAAVFRGAVPIYVLLFSTADFLFVQLASCGCARHDRRGPGTRGRAFVRAILWMYADMPLDYDHHRRMGWTHALLVIGHGWIYGWACIFYRSASPLARWCATKQGHLGVVALLLSVKVVVFSVFWLAYAYESAGDARLDDHVAVSPLNLRKDDGSVELRAMFPEMRRKPATVASTGWSPLRTSSPRVDPSWEPEARRSPRVAPADGGALLFQASPRVAAEGVPVRVQASLSWSPGASPRVALGGNSRQRASPRAIVPGLAFPGGSPPQGRQPYVQRLSPEAPRPSQSSPRVAPADGGVLLFQASPRVAPDGELSISSDEARQPRASPRVAPNDGGALLFQASSRVAPDV